MYRKEIIYLNLFENDAKIKCVGYFKLERKQENYCMELQVKNIPAVMGGKFPLRIQSGNDWKEADMLELKDGSGKWAGKMGEAAARVEIILSDTYRIKGESIKAQNTGENSSVSYKSVQPQDFHEKDNSASEGGREQKMHEKDNGASEGKRAEKVYENSSVVNGSKIPQGREIKTDAGYAKNSVGYEARAAEKSGKERTRKYENAPLYESKWEQLLATYENIHPYGDNRVYVKLEPKDFIVLRSNYQHLVNNSFLLHGFYNYRYLILGKEKEFYVGVPGVFYEREKMVALMFGFEAFECEGGEAQEGKFGYYLRKVEI